MPRPRSTVKQARVQPVTAKSPTDVDREGGKRLRALREEGGMSQTALAERAGITFLTGAEIRERGEPRLDQ